MADDVGRELHGRTLGIIGYGNIGALVAGYGRALGMHVLAWGRAASLERAAADGYEAEPELDALCERSDVVSVHLKLTPETRGLVTARHLSLMKPDALFVNTARAGLVEQGALAAALAAGRPGSAAVDVFDEEPAHGDPLVASDAVLATPHLGYVTWETYETLLPAGVRPGGRVRRRGADRRRESRGARGGSERRGAGVGRPDAPASSLRQLRQAEPAASQPGSPRRRGRSGRRAPPRTRTPPSSRSRSHTSTMSRLP